MLFAWIARCLVGLGLSRSAGTKAAPWIAGFALCLLVVAVFTLAVSAIRADAVKKDRAASDLEALQGQAKADARAADQRLKDDRAQRAQEDDYHDAVERPAPGDSDDAGVRLACERLRHDGQDTTAIPACGGR
ncbi:hypothetical protein [Novosphingobium sp. KN65.2]|uniref:hypothetical protein n=1 Tax=Novosphingobium sp. KN65.2 TaxID=1478134 RepID=UPI0005EA1D48|nr:hypothetical protein [Novosphingobium sp. KN65.2]CDO35829.1 exported hypothetical protein [Novosphingobium sp. KN65.2]